MNSKDLMNFFKLKLLTKKQNHVIILSDKSKDNKEKNYENRKKRFLLFWKRTYEQSF